MDPTFRNDAKKFLSVMEAHARTLTELANVHESIGLLLHRQAEFLTDVHGQSPAEPDAEKDYRNLVGELTRLSVHAAALLTERDTLKLRLENFLLSQECDKAVSDLLVRIAEE